MIVVDASVAFKWFVIEQDSEAARALLDHEQLIVPDLIIPDVMNATWKAVRRRLVAAHEATEVATRLPECFVTIVPTQSLANEAIKLAVALDHAVYDAFYIALAEREDIVLVTADEVLLRKTRRPRFARRVRPLAP